MSGTTDIAVGGKLVSATNPVPVSATVTATANTVGTATAAAPTYTEGQSDAALSLDLNGNLRTLASVNASLAATAHAADPTFAESSSNGLTTDLSGHLRVLAKQQGGWTATIDTSTPGVTNAVAVTNLPASVSVNAGAADNGTFRTTLASNDPLVSAIGAKTDAKSAATDTTAVSVISVLKQLSAYLANPLAVTGTFFQGTQPVSISGSVPVTGTFWQATQPISATALPLPAGAATSAKQPALGTAGTPSADVITVQGSASGTPLPVSVSGSVAVTGAFYPATQPVSLASSVSVTGTFWQATQPVSLASCPSHAITNLPSAVDVNTGAATNGTLRVACATNNPAIALWGHGALGAAVPANATLGGLLAKTALPAAGTDGNMVAPMADKFGRAITRNFPRELLVPYSVTITTTASTPLVAAQGIGVLADLARCIIANESATDVTVTISDGTLSYPFAVKAGQTAGWSGPADTAQPASTANTAWTATVSAAVTQIVVHGLAVLNK